MQTKLTISEKVQILFTRARLMAAAMHHWDYNKKMVHGFWYPGKGSRNRDSQDFWEHGRLREFQFFLVALYSGGHSDRNVLGESHVHIDTDEHKNIDSDSDTTKGINVLTAMLRLPFMVTPKT